MNLASWIVLALVLGAAVAALAFLAHRRRRRGSSSCASCALKGLCK